MELIGPLQILFMLGNAGIPIADFLLLQHGYRSGDFSLVYPMAGGAGPTLSALITNPVSYIAPAREIRILIGTVMGSQWLAEGEMHRRLPAAAAMRAGLIVLALG